MSNEAFEPYMPITELHTNTTLKQMSEGLPKETLSDPRLFLRIVGLLAKSAQLTLAADGLTKEIGNKVEIETSEGTRILTFSLTAKD